MLNRSKEEALKFIEENTGKMTTKEIGFALGVSGARVSQMRGEGKYQGITVVGINTAEQGSEVIEQGPEAA